MFCTAEPASGSVMPMLIRASPSAAAGSQRSFMASGPRCSIPRGGPLKVSWQQMAEDTSARAISSSTMAASTSPRPMPPHCSPMVMRSRSAAASALRTSAGHRPVLVALVGPRCHLPGGHVAGQLAQGRLVLGLGQQVVARHASAHQSELGADDADEADALAGGAAQVVGQPERAPRADRRDLALRRRLARAAAASTRRACAARTPDRVPEALQPAVGVDRQLAVAVEGAGQHFLPGRAPLGEARGPPSAPARSGVKQSCTSAMASWARGSVMPAWA